MEKFTETLKPELQKKEKAFESLYQQLFEVPKSISRKTILDSMLYLALHLGMTELYNDMALMDAEDVNVMHTEDINSIADQIARDLIND